MPTPTGTEWIITRVLSNSGYWCAARDKFTVSCWFKGRHQPNVSVLTSSAVLHVRPKRSGQEHVQCSEYDLVIQHLFSSGNRFLQTEVILNK